MILQKQFFWQSIHVKHLFERDFIIFEKMIPMNLQVLKIELVRQILDIENKNVIDKLFLTLKNEKKDFWSDLSDAQKKEVELGLSQIDKGETEDWDAFLKRVS